LLLFHQIMVASFKRYNRKGPTSLESLVGIFLLSLSLVGWVYADGRHINKCTLDPNHLII
jgi:hypothetical protein